MSDCPNCLKPALTREHAIDAARRGRAKDHHSSAYRCPVGNGWHVGIISGLKKPTKTIHNNHQLGGRYA
ncbi:hypothetical protein [Ottowia sp. VDI28]|uniref:hypothetical protein n=1 Tax=Ottowia sp. VDI28 TaxID=3133968 RepID=UPI003C2F2B01